MKILIAADGSDFSTNAVDACREFIAKPETTEFKIVSAVEFPNVLPYGEFGGASVGYYNELEKAGNLQAEGVVDRVETQLRSLFPDFELNIAKEVLSGSPGQVIVEEAERWGAGLIVAGSHGYGFWSRTFMGSVSQAIVHHSPCSVLIVRMNKSAVAGIPEANKQNES